MAKRISLSSHRLPGAMPVPCPNQKTPLPLLTLRDVRRIVRQRLGRQPHPSTIFRWCQSERLPSVRVAGISMSSPRTWIHFSKFGPYPAFDKGPSNDDAANQQPIEFKIDIDGPASS